MSIGLGETKTCTFVNDDKPGTLIVKKVVINDNGGSKIATDFKFKVNGGNATSFIQDGDDTLKGLNTLTVNAGTYSVIEDGLPITGYDTTYDTCSNVTVSLGETKTCTITNDDQPGTIIIKKIIKGTATSTGFQFQTTGEGYTDGFKLNGGDQNSQNLKAGSYTARELVPSNWVLTGIGGAPEPNSSNCTVQGSGGSTGVGNLATQTVSINLKNGDTVTCVFENTGSGTTRTQGFWATHPQLAQIAWDGGTKFGHTFPGVSSVPSIGDKLIKGKMVTAVLESGKNQLMGGFWGNVTKTSTGAKRSALDQARMQLLQQLLAAELNASAFGSVPSGGTAKFAAWELALSGVDQKAIQKAQSEAAAFNEAGDSGTFTPGTSADSKNAKVYADIPFWNTF